VRVIVATIATVLVLILSTPAVAQSGSPEPTETMEPAPTEATTPPAAQATTERPTLHEPLALPKGRKPVLATGRAPDATASRRGVRLDLWVPKRAVRTGRWVPATMRVTNLSGRPINHSGQVGCDTGSELLRFDFAGLFDAGKTWSGKAARFKKLFLAGRSLASGWMTTVQPVRTDCLGSVGTNETLESGRAFTVSKVAFAHYPWASQPLPSGKAKVTACYGFEFGRYSYDAPAADRHYDLCVSAPVRIKGPRVEYPSPQALTDAMLADPTFRTWVEDRYPNAMFDISVDGPWRKRGYYSWASDEYVGGPAPEELVRVSSQAGGRNGDWVRDLVIDAWTAQVLETTIVGGIAGAPEGDYPTPSPAPTEMEPGVGPGAIDGTWAPMARSPFGAHLPAAAWTGAALVVVDPETARAASYDPASDLWAELGPAPASFSPFDASIWTGTELIIFPDRLSGDPMALDPGTDSWRVLSPMPADIYFDPEFAVWTGDAVVLAGGNPPQAATYDPAADAWASLSRLDGRWVIGLTWTGSQVLAETQGPSDDEPTAVWRLDLPSGQWTPAAPGPASPAVGPGLWVDGVLAYLRTDDAVAGPESDAAYDPVADEWRPLEAACGVHTIEAVAAGSVIVLGSGRAAMDVESGACTRFERPTSGIYGGGSRVWTGDDVLFWSGIEALDGEPQPKGTRLALDEAASRE
jgi:hypothetical protein